MYYDSGLSIDKVVAAKDNPQTHKVDTQPVSVIQGFLIALQI